MDPEFSKAVDYTKSGKLLRLGKVRKQTAYTSLDTAKSNLSRELIKIMKNTDQHEIYSYVNALATTKQFRTLYAPLLALTIANIHDTTVPQDKDGNYYIDHLGEKRINHMMEQFIPDTITDPQEREDTFIKFRDTLVRYTTYVLQNT